MIGRKSKVQPDILGIDNDSLAKVLESLEYTKGVRSNSVFESVDIKELKDKSLLLYEILVGFSAHLTLNGFRYSFGSAIERTHPDMKSPKQSRWTILKRN